MFSFEKHEKNQTDTTVSKQQIFNFQTVSLFTFILITKNR